MRVKRAELRIKRKPLPWHKFGPALRRVAMLSLVVALVFGSARWLVSPTRLKALEFTPQKIYTGTGAPDLKDVATADLDSDGDQDIVATANSGVYIFENEDNDFSFQRHRIDDKNAERVQIIDINDDGRLDILVTYVGDEPSVRWFQKSDSGQFDYATNEISTAGSNSIAYAGDYDNDDDVDIVTASTSSGTVSLQRWDNDGSASFSATTLDADSGVTSLTIAYADDDAWRDIITGGTEGLERWDFDGSSFSEVTIDVDSENRTHLAAGLSSTGDTLIASVNHVLDEVVFYDRNVDNSYDRNEIGNSIDGKSVLLVDLDQDDDKDFLVTDQDNNKILWFTNDGSDNFSKRTLVSDLGNVYGVATADFDGDGDLDMVAADGKTGDMFVFERLFQAPVATAPTSISQSVGGGGIVTFKTTISDADSDLTKARIQYSLDGDHWYKPYLTSVTANTGTVDLKNSNGFQIGTSNSIDTSEEQEVELTIKWDTKSEENTGPPILGDIGTVQLRIIPADVRGSGVAAVSKDFRVDNVGPVFASGLVLGHLKTGEALLTWGLASDSSDFNFRLYYGEDHSDVLEQKATLWDSSDDAKMGDVENLSTTIADDGFTSGKRFSFKLFVEDKFGNETAISSVRGEVDGDQDIPVEADPTPTPTATPETSPTATADPSASPDASATPEPSLSPTPVPSPTPRPTPSTLLDNKAPVADAGPDQIVNINALVVLDGTASFDPDPGQTSQLNYQWRQLAGPDVDLLSDRTSAPSFSAEDPDATYVFALTVRDNNGASSIDTVTTVTQTPATPTPVAGPVEGEEPLQDVAVAEPSEPQVLGIWGLVNIVLFALSVASTLVLLLGRFLGGLRKTKIAAGAPAGTGQAQGRVVHHQTGKPILGAQILVYDKDNKLRQRLKTNQSGNFPTFFPKGTYKLGVTLPGYVLASSASKALAEPGNILYAGGALEVKQDNKPIAIVVPLKPTTAETSSMTTRLLHVWQFLQLSLRWVSWPLFVAGALLNTVLIFTQSSFLFLALEAGYIVLIILKIALEIRTRPAYGLVRDAVTHIPLDLAVVRLFDARNHKLIMTRVTNNQGKFFALPPAGKYSVTISKPGYVSFSKNDLEISSSRDSTLQMTADLMPTKPGTAKTGLSSARGATI